MPVEPKSLPVQQEPQPRVLPSSPELETAPQKLSNETEARVSTKTLQVRRGMEPTSDPVVLLKAGDSLTVLATSGAFSQVRYYIDGDFPVEGWVPSEGIKMISAQTEEPAELSRQAYEPNQTEESVVTSVQEVPQEELPESVELPEEIDLKKFPDPTRIPSTAGVREDQKKSSPSLQLEPQKRQADRDWQYQLGFNLGRSTFKEALSSQGDSQEFLSYKIQGLLLEAQGKATHALKAYQTNTGLTGSYTFNFYDSSVGGGNTNVVPSSIQAQRHHLRIGGFLEKDYQLHRLFIFNPEAQFNLHFEYFATNQLRTTGLGTINFPVLFGYWAFYPSLDFIPRLYLPYDFQFSPLLSLILIYMFDELDTQTVGTNLVGTGKADKSFFGLKYGFDLLWNMRSLRLENADLRLGFHMTDIDRKFKGNGNRAAIAVQNGKSNISISEIQLGFEYQF